MATSQEVEEVVSFLQRNNGEWTTCAECEQEMPSLMHRLKDASDCLPYYVNAVCAEAGIQGGVEEHGYDEWLVVWGNPSE